VPIVTRILTTLLVASISLAVTSIACSTPATDAPAASAQPAAAAAKAAAHAVSACSLVTPEEIAAAGWSISQSVPTENPGPPALSICNFMGADLTRVVTVWYGEGSGGRFNRIARPFANHVPRWTCPGPGTWFRNRSAIGRA
jgi:hypothetical protein